jgi:hypothetical protein
VNSSLRIIVTGLIAQHPQLGGMTWHYLQYLLGLTQLGHDVYYFEDSGEHPYNLDGGLSGNDWVASNCTYNTNYLSKIMTRFGMDNKWAYRFPQDSQWFGLTAEEREKAINFADLLINVSGTLEKPTKYRQIPILVYIDTDPIITQVKMAGGNIDFLKRINAHDTHFSFGETISGGMFETEINWQPTRQPIVLSEWQPSSENRERFTTVMSWTSYQPLKYAGQNYGQKDVEFMRFIDLPKRVAPSEMEIALSRTQHLEWQDEDINKSPEITKLVGDKPKWTPQDLLKKGGWHIIDSIETCGDLDSYRDYIKSSKAEWSVAKNAYVLGQPGWFSERSACYLAAGRPVVIQDTGFTNTIPVGEGILSFESLEESIEGIKDVEVNYERHMQAARSIAEAYFASDKVLSHLIDKVMTSN